jgi:cation diffusion facilitator CzcD-associated flavoprotein CzcO
MSVPDPEKHDFDVLIVGAGLSGIGAACHLETRLPQKSYAILEARGTMGGTWDLFRYPGVRSDSDMYTLGYRFYPWRQAKAIADGPSILSYIKETATTYGVTDKIRFNSRVTAMDWDSASARWRVYVEGDATPYTCSMLIMCSGYYRYSAGYTPDFEGRENFKGQIVHPQGWPEDLDWSGKRVVVIGSGATAVTLIPSMAEKAAHITMLQRSPTYMFAMPATSPTATFLRKYTPQAVAYKAMRWLRVCLQQFTFKLARARPKKMRERLINLTREALPEGYDVERHFSPAYNPWDQRICLVPDNDLFETIGAGKASVVTDEIERFTEDGIRLKSGEELKADIIITATGLVLEAFGGAEVRIDGETKKLGDLLSYKGMMLEGAPNLISVFGYTNASWTLRSDLVAEYACRLIQYMDKKGYNTVTPVNDKPDMARRAFLDFSSGYVTRATDYLPKQGDAPWRHPQNYFSDIVNLRHGKLEDGVLRFGRVEANSSKKLNVAAE